MEARNEQGKQYTVVDNGVFDSTPIPTQIYAFKWTIENLKNKLENPITREGIDTDGFQIKDKKANGNEMTLAVSLSAAEATYTQRQHLVFSLLKKSMSCNEDVTICWSVTIESSNGESRDKMKSKLRKDVVSPSSDTFKHKDYFYVDSMEDLPLSHITLYLEVIWPEGRHFSETRAKQSCKIKGVVVEHMMMNRKYSDIKLTCKDREFNCHQVILASQSPVFDTMFSNKDNLEVEQGVVTIKDMEPEELEAFLKFIYTGKFDDNMKLHARILLAAADKYDIKDLMILAEDELAESLNLENAIDIILLAHLHNVRNLRRKTLQTIITNFDCIAKQTQWKDLKDEKCEMVELVEAFVEIGKM